MATVKAKAKDEEVPEAPAPEPLTDAALPEVRFCDDNTNRMYGCIAVKSAVPFGEWFIGNPGIVQMTACGGHWGTNAEVENWKVLNPPAKS